MLVDLARNDLSRNGHQVNVESYREVQFFSHVIHLVKLQVIFMKSNNASRSRYFSSRNFKWSAKTPRNATNRRVRKTNRNFYGGAIGLWILKATLITPL
jgi:anthranilate synthase component 1